LRKYTREDFWTGPADISPDKIEIRSQGKWKKLSDGSFGDAFDPDEERDEFAIIDKNVIESISQFSDSDVVHASGVIFVDPEGAMLFTRRSDTGQWSIPAGEIEPGEEPDESASREAAEEIGKPGDFTLEEIDHRTTNGVDFYTFVQRVDARFDPILNDEHTDFCWAVPDEAPQPMHPGLLKTLLRLSP
jgi:8-oxo-dGTP pyrophosphatase MutT (NUDIX family)